MAFIKSADNRQGASFAVRPARSSGYDEDEEEEEEEAEEDINIAEGNPFIEAWQEDDYEKDN